MPLDLLDVVGYFDAVFDLLDGGIDAQQYQQELSVLSEDDLAAVFGPCGELYLLAV
jgi:hypothetical protein